MTTVRLLKNGVEAFPAMFAAIDGATICIELEMYYFADDATGRECREKLVHAARRGVAVRVLADAVGSWQLPDDFWNVLAAVEGSARIFRPVLGGMYLFRNHRKLLLVDERVAYIGGMNIGDEYFRGKNGEPPWRDNMLEFRGAEAHRLRRSFDRMWILAGLPFRKVIFRGGIGPEKKLVPGGRVRFLESGPGDPHSPVRRSFRRIIAGATGKIDLAMGYFYPSGKVLRSLRRAVRRGVKVRLLMPMKSDVAIARWAARGLYGRLLRSGVEVWEYRPAMMHAKLAIIDDLVMAGSANLDVRSTRINYELVAAIRDQELAARARADFEEDLAQSERIMLEAWQARPVWQKVKEWISYLLLARLDFFFAKSDMAKLR
ncbi:MAG: phospholipase D-like domain-containing protein [Nitrospiraceae bacterium]|nr:phospholipase D-like domain-containing protein [Nitrospiraceae bacterium]